MDGTRQIPHEVLVEILEDAHRAPTHGLTQPWRFQVFTGEARAHLGDGLQRLYTRVTPTGQRDYEKRMKLGASPRSAAAIISVAAKVDKGGRIPEIEEIAATSCAVQNLMLSAHEKGIGSFWSTPPVTMSPEFAIWLGLDSTHRMLGVVYLGYAQDGKTPGPTPREPLDNHVVFHDH